MSRLQQRLEILTRQWWFFLVVLVLFFLPSYTSRPLDPRRTSELITAVLSNPLIYSVPSLMVVAKLLPVLLVAALAWWGDRATRVFDIYVASTVLLFALFQNMARTTEFGFAVLVGNVVVYLLVALFWLWEAIIKANDFSRRPPLWRYWVVPLACLAFSFPVNPTTLGPDFSLAQLVANSAGLTLCMMLPVYLAILTLYYPAVNGATLRLTSFAGTITALLNVLQWFLWTAHAWMGVVHLPLLVISLYAFILSLRRSEAATIGNTHA